MNEVSVRIGSCTLSKDLVWCCGCGRGLSLSGRWLFCPTCGNSINQQSYKDAVAEAFKHGAGPFIAKLSGYEEQEQELLSKLTAAQAEIQSLKAGLKGRTVSRREHTKKLRRGFTTP